MRRRAAARRANRPSILLLLSLALLLAQAGALVHFYSHLGAGQDPAGLGGASQVCGECLSFDSLLSAGGPGENAVPVASRGLERLVPLELNGSVPTFCHVAFRSRAPPGAPFNV